MSFSHEINRRNYIEKRLKLFYASFHKAQINYNTSKKDTKMARHFFKKIAYSKKFNEFLEKHKLPKAYFAINRDSITKGLLVGFFWGFIPMPMQMAGVMLTTPFLKFNVPLALATVWLSNPFTYPFMFYMEYKTGLLLMGKEGLQNIELTMDWFSKHWSDIAIPMYVGAAFWATVGSYVIYLLVNRFWIYRTKKEWRERRDK